MKYAAMLGAAAAASSHHARDEDPLFDLGGVTDLQILDFFDGFIDIRFSDSDRQRYDKCYEKLP